MFSFSKSHNWIRWVVAGSFAVGVAYSFYFRIHPVVDAQAYDVIAVNIVNGHGFRENIDRDIAHDYAIVRAGPGYEYFLAGLYFLFGHHYEAVWIAQAILHALSVYLIYRLSLIAYRKVSREFSEHISIISATIFAFWPDLIEISAMLMTETLYLFVTILIIYLFVRAFEKPDSQLFAGLLGIATAIGVLTRPPLLLFLPVFLFFYASKRQWRLLLVFCSLFIAVLSPWTFRNYFVYNQFIPTTLIGSYNIWIGNTLASDGGQISQGFNPVTTYIENNGVYGLKEAASGAFASFVASHPFEFIRLTAIRFIRYFSLIRPMGFWFYQTGAGQMIFVFSSLVWIAFVFLAGFVGMASAIKNNRNLSLIRYLAILALTSPLVLLPTVVQSRYRFQIYPFLVMFAAYFITRFMEDRGMWKQKTVWIPMTALLALSFADLLMNVPLIAARLSF